MKNELMFFSQNPTNKGADYYALGEKILNYNSSEDDSDINTLIARIFEVKSKGVIVGQLKYIEGMLLNDEFVLSISLVDLDNAGRQSFITCYGSLGEKDYEKNDNSEESIESVVLQQTNNFSKQISQTLPNEEEVYEDIKSIFKIFYNKRKKGLTKVKIMIDNVTVKTISILILISVIFLISCYGFFASHIDYSTFNKIAKMLRMLNVK